MTQGVLAKRLGVRIVTLRNWENDMSEPRANRLSMLAGLLNVSMMWLITGEGDGVDAPLGDETSNSDIREVLTEIRTLRIDMLQKAEAMARLEKRLRTFLDTAVEV
jgi:transcriptional regulator with XRE-family HTH domain